MPNTFVSRSWLHACSVWMLKRITHIGSVDFVPAGRKMRRYYVTWA